MTTPEMAQPLRPRPETLDFLATRRSRPPRFLSAPVPDKDALLSLLTTATRVPDHGKLEPWRMIVLQGQACKRLATLTEQVGQAEGRDPEKLAKDFNTFADAPLIVAVVLSIKSTDRIPAWEQEMSAACVCLSLVNAALASGWGASWLTGWQARNRRFLTEGLGLASGESIAGFVHIGSETQAPPDRPRPDAAQLTQWVSE